MNTQPALQQQPVANDSLLLDDSVKTLLMQFIIRDRALVSGYLWQGDFERTQDEHLGPGQKIILPTLHVGVKAFLMELSDSDFLLIDASGEEQTDKKIVRFVFGRRLQSDIAQQHQAYLLQHAEPSLRALCNEAMWQLCAFRNPRKDGFGISLNFNTRTPYQTPHGKLRPDKFLRLIDNRLLLD